MELGAALAFRTARRIAESNSEQMLETDIIGRKTARKLAEYLGLHLASRIANFSGDNIYLGEGYISTPERKLNSSGIM